MVFTLLQFVVSKAHAFFQSEKQHPRLFIEVVSLIAAVFIGIGIHRHYNPPITVVQTVPGQVQTVTVDRPVLTPGEIEKIVSDPKDKAAIKALSDENSKLKLQITSLTSTVATLQSHGSGVLETDTAPPVSDGSTGVATPPVSTQSATTPFHFQDYRLNFRSPDGKNAEYDLTQKFSIFTTTGKDKDGKQASLVKLYEVGPTGDLMPVSDVKTTAIFSNPEKMRLFVSPAIQAGLALTAANGDKTPAGGIVGFQWLKYGNSSAAADTKYAYLTPVLFFNGVAKEVGILPASINLGRIPHQPFQNLWVSPYVGSSNIAAKTITRIGIGLTATF